MRHTILVLLAAGLLAWLAARDPVIGGAGLWLSFLFGLFLCLSIVGINELRRWWYNRKLRTYADESFFLIRGNDTTLCTCRTQQFGELCRIHTPFFF